VPGPARGSKRCRQRQLASASCAAALPRVWHSGHLGYPRVLSHGSTGHPQVQPHGGPGIGAGAAHAPAIWNQSNFRHFRPSSGRHGSRRGSLYPREAICAPLRFRWAPARQHRDNAEVQAVGCLALRFLKR
jgi:hypothetical protein